MPMIPELSHNLKTLEKMFQDYVVLPEHASTALVLWVAHTHASTAFYTTPRIILSSAQPGSGKTRVLELLSHVSANPLMTMNISSAALFRTVNKAALEGHLPPTILFDEVDTVFSPKAKGSAEEIRALINSGYKKGANTVRCVGDSQEVKEFATFSPVALAGLAGHMPATITTRAISIEMKKRHSDEKFKAYRSRDVEEKMSPVKDYLANWGAENLDTLSLAYPVMPDGVEDRPAEVWEALLAVADMAGDDWPQRAREACVHFVFSNDPNPPTIGEELLHDIREVMGHGAADYPMIDKASTTELLSLLLGIEDGAWAGLDGRDLTPRRLSQLLAPYQVRPVDMRDIKTGRVIKGYTVAGNARQAGLADAWTRYLPKLKDDQPEETHEPKLWGVPAPIGQGIKA